MLALARAPRPQPSVARTVVMLLVGALLAAVLLWGMVSRARAWQAEGRHSQPASLRNSPLFQLQGLAVQYTTPLAGVLLASGFAPCAQYAGSRALLTPLLAIN